MPTACLTLLFCWFLTGVTRIDLNERGSYERLGLADRILGLSTETVWPMPVVAQSRTSSLVSSIISSSTSTDGSNVVSQSAKATPQRMTSSG